MSDSAIQTSAKPAEALVNRPAVSATRPTPQVHRSRWWWLRRILQFAASLRITVVLFLLAALLIFFGTLAQVDAGIWTVVSKYFRCFITWIPLKIFFPSGMREVPGGFPFPGGWLIAGLLLANLLAAHAVRFRLTWKRAGVMVLHAGLIVMVVSEFVTGLFAVEGQMPIVEGQSANYVVHSNKYELAVISHVNDSTDHVVVVPAEQLVRQGVIKDDALPFDIQVLKYMANSEAPTPVAPSEQMFEGMVGAGVLWTTVEKPENSGVDTKSNEDMPSSFVAFKDRETGKSLGTYFLSRWWSALNDEPQKVETNGKTYGIELRWKRTYKPYSVHLEKYSPEYYPNSDTPKEYASTVQVIGPDGEQERSVTISMNAPLRHGGETFYQAGFLPNGKGTILQVVRNPGWLMPYISCALVSIGMMVHFGIQLVEFLRRRNMA